MKTKLVIFVLVSLNLASSPAASYTEDQLFCGYQLGSNFDEQALQVCITAAKQGNMRAQTTLGNMYYNGVGVPQNLNEAVHWYGAAAEQGDSWAQYRLGYMYHIGRGVVQNYREAMRWYRAAAEQGYGTAQHFLALMHQNGSGVLQNFILAHMWYNIAAANGDELATEYRNRIARQMTAQQIAEAQALAVQCMNSNYTMCNWR